jgi:hypothetical protein
VHNFTVSNNHLNGSLPAEMGAMENLRMFTCSKTGLPGKALEVASNWTQAEVLLMDNDKFTCEVPPLDKTWPHISEFNFANNSLSLSNSFCHAAVLPSSLNATSCLPDPHSSRQGCCLEGNRSIDTNSSPCASAC